MIYLGLKNLASQEVRTFSNPLQENVRVQPKEPTGMDKEARRKWLSDASTDTCVFSLWEGLNTSNRINAKAENPPWKMHGLVVDYDAPSPGNLQQIRNNVEQILKDTPVLLPQWGVITPSGNHRLVWEFESPVNVGDSGDAFILETLEALKKLLKLPLLLAGLDEAAFKKPSTYYDIGGIWERFNANPLPSSEVQGVFYKAVKTASKGKAPKGSTEIPMDLVFKEIEAKFPGKWPKDVPFEDGCLGPAVWHPDAKNQKTTVYRPWGIYCFSAEDRLFKSYAEILGKDFTRKFEENKIGAATEAIYYIPRVGYYRKWPDGAWRAQPKDDLILYLAGAQGLSRTKGQGNSPSEVENALLHIQQSKVLDGAVPVVYDNRETLSIAGGRFLNLARVKVLEPDTTTPNPQWGQGFPWIAAWLGSMFTPKKQLVYLLAWLKLFYEGARNGSLNRGHAVFMVGGTNRGKTLMNAFWIPLLMGGGSEAGDFLVGGESFCKELLQVGHWHIDDSLAASDRIQHQKFSERVKRLIANPMVAYHPKFVDRQMVPFNGRLMVTLNEDPISLLMIPDLDRNIEDKLMVFGLNSKPFVFQGNAATERTLRQESPFFLNWLLNWRPLKSMVNTNHRWGMQNYIHPVVRRNAVANSYDSDLSGVLDILWETDNDMVELKQKGEPWVGTAAALTSIVNSHPSVRGLIHAMTVRSIGMRLSKLAKTSGTGVKLVPHRTKAKTESTKYAIYHNDL